MVLGEGKMKFNKDEVPLLAGAKSCHFEKEGVLFIQEKVEGFFRRNEGKNLAFLSFYKHSLLLIS